MGKLWLALPVLTLCAAQLAAQWQEGDDATKPPCARYEHAPLPAEATAVPVPKHWPNCRSYKLYSGGRAPADFETARKCAWVERLASQAGLEPVYGFGRVFGGSAVLTMLYANGQGVEKNIPLAIRFACESGWAPGEVDGRVEHIEARDGQPLSSDSSFKFCDDPASDFMSHYCESYTAQLADQARTDALNALSAQWPEPQRAALAKLDDAEAAYSEAHGKSEVDVAGASRGSQQIQAQESVRESFLAALRAFEKGEFPGDSAGAAERTDAELNQVYRNAIEKAEAAEAGKSVELNDGAVEPDGLRNAEEAWLKYRDAWIEFARLRYPSVGAESWLALLTRDRIATIRGSPCESDPDDSDCAQRDTNAPRPLP